MAYSPVQDTWARSVNRGYFNTWPGITSKEINKMPKAEATIKGHLAQSRENTVQQQPTRAVDKNRLTQIQHKNKMIYTDQTGNLPMTSIQVNKYILIMYVYDANVILAAPLKSMSGSHILEAYTKKV